jgi:hypothetical protein
MSEDKRLERLYDYTKWHIGIYLGSASALTAAVGYLADRDKAPNLDPLIGSPLLLVASVVLMLLAGACGGVVASSSTECVSYDELWSRNQGPFGTKLLPGKTWAMFEHAFFWLSVAAVAVSVLAAPAVRTWIFK